jgi:hypothetical protein
MIGMRSYPCGTLATNRVSAGAGLRFQSLNTSRLTGCPGSCLKTICTSQGSVGSADAIDNVKSTDGIE